MRRLLTVGDGVCAGRACPVCHGRMLSGMVPVDVARCPGVALRASAGPLCNVFVEALRRVSESTARLSSSWSWYVPIDDAVVIADALEERGAKDAAERARRAVRESLLAGREVGGAGDAGSLCSTEVGG